MHDRLNPRRFLTFDFADIGDQDESFHENFKIDVLSQDEDELKVVYRKYPDPQGGALGVIPPTKNLLPAVGSV
ncbi:hypothetical protein QL285_078018 [Trifolium repens]|nr:hypothetical protein QL285_078018 [Trifolium repens]